MDKIIIKMPLYEQAMLQCEIDADVWGSQKDCSKLLSQLLSAYYEYPIKVTVETDIEEIEDWEVTTKVLRSLHNAPSNNS